MCFRLTFTGDDDTCADETCGDDDNDTEVGSSPGKIRLLTTEDKIEIAGTPSERSTPSDSPRPGALFVVEVPTGIEVAINVEALAVEEREIAGGRPRSLTGSGAAMLPDAEIPTNAELLVDDDEGRDIEETLPTGIEDPGADAGGRLATEAEEPGIDTEGGDEDGERLPIEVEDATAGPEATLPIGVEDWAPDVEDEEVDGERIWNEIAELPNDPVETPNVGAGGIDEDKSELCPAAVELLMVDAGGFATDGGLLLTGVSELAPAGMLVDGCWASGKFEDGWVLNVGEDTPEEDEI